jgi:putative photosynthetic complex assembly protein
MSASHAPTPLPRLPLLALAALVLVSLISVAAVRWSGLSVHTPDAKPIATRLLRFEDGTDGSIAVIDAATGGLLERVHGEQGFLRGSLRALARERRMRDVGSLPPFELAARADGRLTLMDTATGARIDLESFGPTNAAVFARLLTLNKNP